MQILDLFSFLLLLLILFLSLQTLVSLLIFTYIFQLKEYRRDRIWAHFKTKTGLRQLLLNFNILKFKKVIFPRPTLRIGLSVLLVLLFLYYFLFILLSLIFPYLVGFPSAILISLLVILVIYIILMPIFSLVTMLFISLMIFPIKELIYYLANSKIQKLENLQVIGITGSYGKTATKEILAYLLSDEKWALATPKNCNTKLGIAVFILKKLRLKHKLFVVEMGAYKKGEIREICNLVRPNIAVLTGINEQHQELFGSFENIIVAKYELVQSLPRKVGVAFYNANNPYVLKISRKRKIKKFLYGRERVFYKTKLAGNWHQENIKGALKIVKFLGLDKNKMIKKLKQLKDFSMSLKIKNIGNGIKVVDDSYSSNPSGFFSALEYISNLPAKKRILIMPGIIELGQASDSIHEQIGRKSALICDHVILTKKDFFKPIKKGFITKKNDKLLEVCENKEILLEKIKNLKKRSNLFLVEGRVSKFVLDVLWEKK
ncbi:Mur ligase family protein [Patescibacteria group bacterium]